MEILLVSLATYVVVWGTGIATQYAASDIARRHKEMNR